MSEEVAHVADKLVHVPGRDLRLAEPAFKVAHSLSDHPLFEADRIRRLLRTMPRDHIEIRRAQQREDKHGDYKRGPMLKDVDPVESFDRLEERPTWMLLHKTWRFDNDYRQLLEDYLHDLTELCPEMQKGITRIGCWMFLSSGKSVVHFHSDDDQSFLNQIRGSKTVYVYPSEVLPESIIEELAYTEDQGAVVYKPEYESRMFEPLHISPGEGAFLPLFAPHRVVNDDGVSVSWNVGFHTRASSSRRSTHYFNYEMRRWGGNPHPFGERARVDRLKAKTQFGLRVKNKLAHTLGRGD